MSFTFGHTDLGIVVTKSPLWALNFGNKGYILEGKACV